jgi:DNA-binding GntR family transcriptional regulator
VAATDGELRWIRGLSAPPSLQEFAYAALRQAIVSHELTAGQRLVEAELAEKLGISRSPVREALRRLQQDGLVQLRPREGVYVSSVTVDEVDDVFRIRAALESTAAALAAERATEDQLSEMEALVASMNEAVQSGDPDSAIAYSDAFHRAITLAARVPRLAYMFDQIYTHVFHFRSITLRTPGRAYDAAEDHIQLMEALRRRDPEEARTIMERHIDDARVTLLQILETAEEETDSKWA